MALFASFTNGFCMDRSKTPIRPNHHGLAPGGVSGAVLDNQIPRQ